MRSRLRALLPILAVLAALVATRATAQSPYPDLDGILANGTDTAVSPARVNGDFQDLLAQPYGLDGLVLVVDNCEPDPEVYLDDALVHYGLADGPGRMYDDAVAWLVCFEPRFVGFFWAANNPHAASLSAESVQDVMADRLAEDNFTGAFTAGIAEAARQIQSGPPPENGQGAGAPGGGALGAGAGPASGLSTSDTSGAQNGGFLGSRGLWIALLGGLLVGVWWWRRRRRARVETALPGQAKAPENWGALADRVAALKKTLTGSNPSVARVVLAYEPLGDEAVLGVHRRHQSNVDRLDALGGRLEAAVQTLAAMDPEENAAQLESLSGEALALEAYVKEMDGEAAHAEMLIERAGILAVEAREALAASAATLAELAADFPDAGASAPPPPAESGSPAGAPDRAAGGPGFPSPADLLAVATAAADDAERWLAEGNRLAGGRNAEEAAEIARRLGEIASDWRALHDRVADSGALYERLDSFARTSWADVSGNGHEAEESLDTVPAMLRRLATEATGVKASAPAAHAPSPSASADGRAFGRDRSAGFLASLEAVEAEIARGNGLVDSVANRLARIEADRHRARPALDEARAEVERARAHFSQPEVDAAVGPGPVDSLSEASASLDAAESAMSTELPDWPAVVALVERASAGIAQALAAAKLEVERLASARRLVESSADSAEAAIERADGFLAAHARDLGSAHLPKLQRARDALDKGKSEQAAAAQLTDAMAVAALGAAQSDLEEAVRLADEAYEAMAADFARIESRRKEYVPRPDWMGPVVPVPVDVRPMPFPSSHRGWRDVSAPRRPSSWGSRPQSGGAGGSSGGAGGSSGSRPSSSRRGGGRGW